MSLCTLLAACGGGSTPAPEPDAGIISPDMRTPCVRSVSPARGLIGSEVTLTGDFGDKPVPIAFSGYPPGEGAQVEVRSWSPTQVVVSVPTLGWGSWQVTALHGCELQPTPTFTVLPPPRIYIHNNADDADGSDTITTLAYDPASGALTQLGPPTSLGLHASHQPGCRSSLLIAGSPSRLQAAGDNGIAVFDIDRATGALSPIAGSPFLTGATGGATLRYSVGAYLWAATDAGVMAWRFDAGGRLVNRTKISAAPARSITLFGQLPTRVYTTRGDDTFDAWSASYKPGQDTGNGAITMPVLAPLTGSPFGTPDTSAPAAGTAFATNNNLLYVPSPAGLRLWQVVVTATEVPGSPFALNAPSGTLGAPLLFGGVRTPTTIYMPSMGSGYIVGAIADTTGAPSAAPGSPWNFAPDVTNLSCMTTAAASPGGTRLIASDAGNRRIAVFDLPGGAAKPIPVAGSPFTMTETPSELASGIAVLVSL